MENTFINLIKTITKVPAEQEEKFLRLVSVKEFSKDSDFISAGQYPKVLGYVKEGLLKKFRNDVNIREVLNINFTLKLIKQFYCYFSTQFLKS